MMLHVMDQLSSTEREKLVKLGQRTFELFRVLDKHFPGQDLAVSLLLALKEHGVDIGPVSSPAFSTNDKRSEFPYTTMLLEKLEQIAPELKVASDKFSDKLMNTFHEKVLSFVHYMDSLDQEQLGDRARRFFQAAGITPRPVRIRDVCAEMWSDWKAEPFIKSLQYLFMFSALAGIVGTIFQFFYILFRL